MTNPPDLTPYTALLGWAAFIVPFAVLGVVALGLPLWLARKLPQSYGGLVLNGCVTAIICYAMTFGYFTAEYMRLGHGPGMLAHIARVSVGAALFWVPVALLALITRVQRWEPDL